VLSEIDSPVPRGAAANVIRLRTRPGMGYRAHCVSIEGVPTFPEVSREAASDQTAEQPRSRPTVRPPPFGAVAVALGRHILGPKNRLVRGAMITITSGFQQL
jgi:hypothetical protein